MLFLLKMLLYPESLYMVGLFWMNLVCLFVSMKGYNIVGFSRPLIGGDFIEKKLEFYVGADIWLYGMAFCLVKGHYIVKEKLEFYGIGRFGYSFRNIIFITFIFSIIFKKKSLFQYVYEYICNLILYLVIPDAYFLSWNGIVVEA